MSAAIEAPTPLGVSSPALMVSLLATGLEIRTPTSPGRERDPQAGGDDGAAHFALASALKSYPLGYAECRLLVAVAQSPQPDIAELAASVARECGSDATTLTGLLDALRAHGLLILDDRPVRTQSGRPAAALQVEDPPALPDDPILVRTPLIFRVTPDGFEHLDHDGNVDLRLDAAELTALAELRTPVSLGAAFEQASALALPATFDRQAFDALIRRAQQADLIEVFDPEGVSGQQNRQNRRMYATYLRLTAAVNRAVEAHEKAEAEHKARTGTTRVRVVPIDPGLTPVPLGLGMIMAYARSYKDGVLNEDYQFVPNWVTNPDHIDRLDPVPSIYMFSNYIWSCAKNLNMSALIKAHSPDSVIVHGGPDTPKYEGDVRQFFASNPHIDVTVHGEGEETFADMLDKLRGTFGVDGPRDLSALRDVPGLSFRDGDTVVHNESRDRLADVNDIPSPFLDGSFDAVAEAMPTAAIIETNRGCPYSCTFCDWGSATASRIRKFDLDRVFAELEWCAKHGVRRVFVADANFGIFERDVEIARKVAELNGQYGFPKLFATNYAKNTVKHLKEIIEIFAEAGILSQGLLSLQSLDTETLKTIKRSNIKVEKYEALGREFRTAGLPLVTDLMLGLPGSTVQSFDNDLQECIDRELMAKVFQTEMLVNSPMNEPSYREEHRIETAHPVASLVSRSENPDGTLKRALLISTASYSRDDYDEMLRIRRVFTIGENYGLLRQISRFVRKETGLKEIEFYQRLRREAEARPEIWPALWFTFNVSPFLGTAPSSWRLVMEELHDFIVSELGVADDTALKTALEVQHALMPAAGRAFPLTVQLDHDYAAWQEAMIAAKDDDPYTWTEVVPHLRDFGPAEFVVTDPDDICTRGIGHDLDSYLQGSWELGSTVARVVAQDYD